MRTEEAKQLLIRNNRGGYTIPSPKLYPFQWNWDSGFIALGLSYYDPEKAMQEIRSMFKGQWKTGLLPHINFHQPSDNYFPGPDVWGTKHLPQASGEVHTSGIIQPPVFGFVLERMMQWLNGKNDNLESFLREIYPKALAFHRYLYEYRDPYNEGLVYIQHNWESGMDNSPIWDEILESISLDGIRDVSGLRRDNKSVDPAERPTNENYNRYIYLVDLFNELSYNDAAISKESPFLVQDVLFNSLLVKSNLGLIAIAERLGIDSTEVKNWNTRTIAGINSKLWNEETGFYFAWDIRNQKSIAIKTISGFMPLFAGISTPAQAERLTHHLTTSFVKGALWGLCPTTAADEQSFNPVKYWRGPVWLNLNWMLYHGLVRYGREDLACRVKTASLNFVDSLGMYEYFDARPADERANVCGLGSDAFSWTAALYLDFLHNPQPL